MGKNTPALYAALVIIGGFLAAGYPGVPAALWAGAAVTAFIVSVAVLARNRSSDPRAGLPSVPIVLLLFCSSVLWYRAAVGYAADHISHYLRLEHPVRVYCRVADEPRVRDGKTIVLVSVEALAFEGDSADVEGNALLTVVANRGTDEPKRAICYGDRITFMAIPEAPPDTRNPGEVSYRDHLATNNIFALLRVSGGEHVARFADRESEWFFESVIFPSRHFVSAGIRSTLAGDEANYLVGLLLGDRSDLSYELRTAFANTGTTHVLAVSGSHVAVIVAAIYAFFGLFRIPRRIKGAATICAIMYYMVLTGSTPSVVRASLMASVVLAGTLVQRRSSVYNSLGLSAILMFLYDPKQLFDVGFQLSFAAVLSMVYLYPKLTSWMRSVPASWKHYGVLQTVTTLFAVSTAAQIGTIPFTAYYFGRVSVVSFLVNVAVVPLAGLNIALGVVATLCGIVSAWAGSCVHEVNGLLARGLLALVTVADRVPYAIVHTASFGAVEAILYVCAAALCVNLARPVFVRRMVLALFLIGDCLLLWTVFVSGPRMLRVTFFDVGQGDAALVEFPGGASMLVDAGPRIEASGRTGSRTAYDAGERILAPALRRKGITRLAAVIVTHLHDDHSGGVPYLEREFRAERLFMPARQPGSCVPGDTINIDPSARVYILHPAHVEIPDDSAEAYRALNNSSIVCRICYGSVSFLMMGDAEREAEEEVTLRYGDFLRSDVVKVGHHGSGSGTTPEFLAAASPREAVVSVGPFNRFRHPSARVLRRIRDAGAGVHRTDREGAVVFETDGASLSRVEWR